MPFPWDLAISSIANVITGLGKRSATESAAQRLEQGALEASDIVGAAANQGMAGVGQAEQGARGVLDAVYNEQRGAYDPYLAFGRDTLSYLGNELGPGGRLSQKFQEPTFNFEAEPGYQFRIQQGQQALERGASARGSVLSGGALKEAIRYGQGFASNEYGNAWNRFQTDTQNRYSRFANQRDARLQQLLGSLGVGERATAGLADTGNTYAGRVSGNLMDAAQINADLGMRGSGYMADRRLDIANARAAGTLGKQDALSNLIASGANTLNEFGLKRKWWT